LVYYEQRVLNRDFFEEKPDSEEGVSLCEGISDVRFEYFREEDLKENKSEGWFDEWDAKEEKALPKAFRMKITLKNNISEKEGIPLTLLASISANQFEEVKAGQTRFRTPGMIRRLPSGSN